MRKLIAGVVLATALAGTANALEFSRVNVGGTPAPAGPPGFTFAAGVNNDAVVAGGQVTTAISNAAAYNLASEILWTAQGTTGPDDGFVTVVMDASTGNFPVGNLVGDLTLVGASFNAAVTGANFTFSCTNAPAPNANLSSGGTAGSQTARFILSNLNSCLNGDFGIALRVPVDVGDTSTQTTVPTTTQPTLTFNLQDPNLIQVDGGPATVRLFNIASAFQVTVDTANGVTNNWAALNPTPLFGTLSANATAPGVQGQTATLGEVKLVINTAAWTNLTGVNAPANKADVTDVTRFSLLLSSLNSQFQGFDLIRYGGGTGQFVPATAFSSNTIELANTGNGSTGTGITALVVADFVNTFQAVLLRDANGGTREAAINASGFTITPSLTLDVLTLNSPGVNGVPALSTTTIGSIFRQGTTITFPWFSSGTQAAATGSTSILRIGNLTASAITAYLTTFDSTVGAAGNVTAKPIAAGVPANGELVINSAAAETLAGVNFGRADVQVIMETNPGNVTARRFVFNGASFTELSPGVAGTPQ